MTYGIFKLSPIHASWFISLAGFVEITEFNSNSIVKYKIHVYLFCNSLTKSLIFQRPSTSLLWTRVVFYKENMSSEPELI